MSSKSGLDGGIRPRFVWVVGRLAGRNGEKFEELVHGGLADDEGGEALGQLARRQSTGENRASEPRASPLWRAKGWGGRGGDSSDVKPFLRVW
jgi:hypothetical protein